MVAIIFIVISMYVLSKREVLAFRNTTGCFFGNIPGMWLSSGDPGDRYISLRPDCHIKNLLRKETFAEVNNSSPIRVLFLTDSLDVFMMHALAAVRNSNNWEDLKYFNTFYVIWGKHDRLNVLVVGRFASLTSYNQKCVTQPAY